MSAILKFTYDGFGLRLSNTPKKHVYKIKNYLAGHTWHFLALVSSSPSLVSEEGIIGFVDKK
jgi:hypothetical protein